MASIISIICVDKKEHDPALTTTEKVIVSINTICALVMAIFLLIQCLIYENIIVEISNIFHFIATYIRYKLQH